MNHQEAELKQQRIQINRAEMIERISRAVPEDGLSEAFPGVVLGRFSKPTERVYSVFKPSFASSRSVASRCFWERKHSATIRGNFG